MSFVIERRFYSMDFSLDGAFGIFKESKTKNKIIPLEDYKQYYRDALSAIRKEYDGKIILTYIPSLYLDNNGMQVNDNPEINMLLQMAPEFDIHVLDATIAFKEKYNEEQIFPLGYWNTHYGPGHLNAEGHRTLADALYKILEVN